MKVVTLAVLFRLNLLYPLRHIVSTQYLLNGKVNSHQICR